MDVNTNETTDANRQLTIRPAQEDDYEAVAAFTRNTWADREGNDYIPRVYHDWIDGDNTRKRTVVADSGDDIAGICQAVMLSPYEAWAQGMRVNPAFRGRGVSYKLNDALFEWAGEQGATVCRNMVFSWNVAGLGGSRAVGFEPVTEFRWAHPEPDPDAVPDLTVESDPVAAWSYWTNCGAREHLAGLALDTEESWALSELTRENLQHAADETGVFAVVDDGMRGAAYRTRTYERESDEEGANETEQWAEYGIGVWDDLSAARSLFAAISADAAAVGADRTRVLIPETPQYVSDAAWLRAGISDEPDFVLEADLNGR
jgi:GNAT superfamily N-acetyltransferase